MGGLSTHVLDLSLGRPAAGVEVALARRRKDGTWQELGRATTDADGRVPDLLPSGTELAAGTYRLTFDLDGYFRPRGVEAFYPEATVVFTVRDAGGHYHVPLLLSPYGYTTYRGS
jgi:5-hydroxyisourate hydrolase